jgi:hypothetical protein
MAKFVKRIVTEGEYLVSTASGQRKKVTFSPKDLEERALTATQMLESGLKIPAPRQHTLDAKPELEESKPDGKYENLGFWDKFYVGETEDGRSALYGVLDAPGDRNDPATPAGQVAKVVQDVSICTHDFVDGKEREWKNAIWHVALPTHPIEPHQENFKALPDDYEVVMMSQRVMTVDTEKLLTALSKCGISLPSDTTDDNLLDRLYVAVTQKAEGSDSSSLNTKSSGTKVETYPIMMSLNQQQVDAILSANVMDPSTGKPFSKDTFADKGGEPSDLKKYKESVVLMSNMLNKSYKERYSDRVKGLIATGRISEEYAKNNLFPMIEKLDVGEAIQMGLNEDGSLPSNAVEVTISALENLQAPAQSEGNVGSNQNLWMSNKPNDSSTQPRPNDVAELNDEDADKLIEQLLKS